MSVSISVVIATHPRRNTVVYAVRSALTQTRSPLEVLVVCDGCTRETIAALGEVDDERVEVLDLPKAFGYGYAHRNLALRRVRGDAVAWLADDDLWLPDHLERLGRLLDDGHRLVCAKAIGFDADGTRGITGADWRVEENRAAVLGGRNTTPTSAVAHTVELARAGGGWPEDVERLGDLVTWQRLLRAGGEGVLSREPTVLMLAAAGRSQEPNARVPENAALLGRIEDPPELARLRDELTLRLAEQEADLWRAQAELGQIYGGRYWRWRQRARRLMRRGG